MKFFSIIILCFSSFIMAQKNQNLESLLLKNIVRLDKLMQENDSKILELLTDDVSFGHSNGWVQNFQDFKKDIESQKVIYNSVNQEEKIDFKIRNNVANVRRVVSVTGFYKEEFFETKLSVLEIWIKQNKDWKLWSRQSVSIK